MPSRSAPELLEEGRRHLPCPRRTPSSGEDGGWPHDAATRHPWQRPGARPVPARRRRRHRRDRRAGDARRDRDRGRPFHRPGAAARRCGRLRLRAARRVAAKEIDIAVHSYKACPTAPVDGLIIAAVPPREDPRDAFISRTHVSWEELPAGSRIGTGALRRIAQLHALRRGWDCEPMRGNVDTRLASWPMARSTRWCSPPPGASARPGPTRSLRCFPPSYAAGARPGRLGGRVPRRGPSLVDQLSSVDDEHTRAAVLAERSLLATLEAGCSAPVAALATVKDTVDGPSVPAGAPARGGRQSRIELWRRVRARRPACRPAGWHRSTVRRGRSGLARCRAAVVRRR